MFVRPMFNFVYSSVLREGNNLHPHLEDHPITVEGW